MDSAPKTAQGQMLNQMSGNGGARPTSRSPGGQRKKFDTNTRGRDKTKIQPAPHSNKGGQGPGRSKSGARECWECNEVVTGDHYQTNCPKRKKKADKTRPMTPYPRRDRSSSKDRTNATQGNETFRRFHAYIGTGPLVLLNPEAMDEPESGTDSEVEPGAEEEPASETESEVEPEGVAVPEPASET